MSGSLAGRAVLVTRPSGLSDHLAELLRSQECEVIILPAIDILPPDDPASLQAIIRRLDEFDIAIFVSPTAAVRACAVVAAERGWPAGLRFAAIGNGTARAARAAGIAAVIAPEGRGDSDALAAMPAFSEVERKSIVIFRGQNGRESLRETLEARGARVEYAQCYKRAMPQGDVAPLVERWRKGGVDGVSITSTEGLDNLFVLFGPSAAPLLRATPIFAPHPRVARAARILGVEQVIVTGSTDEALVEALTGFFAKVRNPHA